MNSKPTMLSGIQPSGQLILGNYTGAIHQWLAAQNDQQCYFMIVDLHSLTVQQDPEQLRQQCYSALALYLACGLDHQQHCIFMQSQVAAHSELMWLLSCLTGMGELQRMTQFKDKSAKHQHNINAGLLTYPVLMAADILLYQPTHVPVGDDQKQHLELARQLAQRFNHHFGELFVIPEPVIPATGARIMGLQTPEKKMSKSDSIEANVIRLLDAPKVIEKKFKRAVTDSEGSIRYAPDSQPGIANLLSILSVCCGKTPQQLAEEYSGQGYGSLKKDASDAVIALLEPIQQRYQELISTPDHLDQILQSGQKRAAARANQTLQQAKKMLGLIVHE